MPDADFSRRWRFCVAPMLDWTDTHCRVFHRSLSRHARLYTEMITSPALVHGNRDRLLRFSEVEHPVACQLGGSDPAELAQAAKWVAERGYDEVNLNCGCPSERVQRGSFGAQGIASQRNGLPALRQCNFFFCCRKSPFRPRKQP